MADRLSIIATRSGDQGETGLGDGSRVSKTDPRIAALGDVDELNSTLGLLRCEALPDGWDARLAAIQNHLFDLGAELSIPGYSVLQERHVVFLDDALAQGNANLPPLREFILPGGSRAAALSHVARTVCRRAERSVVALADYGTIQPHARHYLNRLSDLCFVLARLCNRHAGQPDVLWQRDAG